MVRGSSGSHTAPVLSNADKRDFVVLEGAGLMEVQVHRAKFWSCSLLLSTPMRWSKGGRNAMTFNECRPRFAAHIIARPISRVGFRLSPGTSFRRSWPGTAAGRGEGFPSPRKDRHTRMGWGSKCSQNIVCTMCTPWASDSVVPASDWAGLAMSSGEGRFFKAWRPVRVPPRAQCFLRSGAF